MDEYMSMTAFCRLTEYKPQTVYNKIYRKELQLGKHYIKPTRKKILFKVEEIRKWLEADSSPVTQDPETRDMSESWINV